MPEFDALFQKSSGQPIEYEGETLYQVDFIPVQKEFRLKIKLISTNSEWEQIISLNALKGGIMRSNGFTSSAFAFSEHTMPTSFEVTGTSKAGKVMVYNAWMRYYPMEPPSKVSMVRGAAMKKEIRGDTIRYYCNDGHPDDNFDDIVFEVTVL